jgi:LacI family transcriptional regulator
LGELLGQNRVSACVLLSASRDLQQWFSAQPVPALLLGSRHPSVSLPSLDFDYRSVCRHAAGYLLKKGHQRLAFLTPDSDVAGHLASEQGFLEGVTQYGRGNAQGLIVRHNGRPQQIIARLDALFDSGRAPTALLVSTQEYVFSVILYLLKRGLKVPDAVSLIARDSDYFFEKVTPAITRYAVALDSYTRLVSRLVLQMVEQGYLSTRPHFIFPRFIAGDTVKQLR